MSAVVQVHSMRFRDLNDQKSEGSFLLLSSLKRFDQFPRFLLTENQIKNKTVNNFCFILVVPTALLFYLFTYSVFRSLHRGNKKTVHCLL